jgi:ABC-type branched-subunit amino acid transport system substrate-binding protein
MMDAAAILSPQEMEGIRVVAPLFASRPDQEKMKAWRDRFRAKYNKEAIYTNAYAYDMTQIINDAAKRLRLPATSQQWVEALRATNIEGITGPLKFDNSGDLVTPIELGVYRNGKLVPNAQASSAAAAGR